MKSGDVLKRHCRLCLIRDGKYLAECEYEDGEKYIILICEVCNERNEKILNTSLRDQIEEGIIKP